MQRETVDQMLSNYRQYAARCEFLRHEIGELERIASGLRNGKGEVVLRAQNLSGMPHGTSVGNPTEQLALQLASGHMPPCVQDIESEIARLKAELQCKAPTVAYVSAWLKGLTDKERFVVENKTIGGAYWRELVYLYQQRFGEIYSRQGLKKIRDGAMQKIYRIAA